MLTAEGEGEVSFSGHSQMSFISPVSEAVKYVLELCEALNEPTESVTEGICDLIVIKLVSVEVHECGECTLLHFRVVVFAIFEVKLPIDTHESARGGVDLKDFDVSMREVALREAVAQQVIDVCVIVAFFSEEGADRLVSRLVRFIERRVSV